jgi:hypothetical protein
MDKPFTSITAIVQDSGQRTFLVNNGHVTHAVERGPGYVFNLASLPIAIPVDKWSAPLFGLSRYSSIGQQIEQYLEKTSA